MEIQKIRLKNFLSFGKSTQELEFSKLNTIVGPNDSGKTNVFRAIELVKKHITDRETPSEAYYHNKDSEHPFEIEIDVKFNLEEKELLTNYLVCGCINQGVRPVEGEDQSLGEEVLQKIVLGNGLKLFNDFCENITIVVDTEGKSRYPPEIYFKMRKENKVLYYQSYRVTKKPRKKGSYSIRNLSDILLSEARKQFPKLNSYITKKSNKIPNLSTFRIKLFDFLYQHTDENLSSEFGGFRLADFEANRTTFPEFIRVRNFIRNRIEDEGANFQEIVAYLFVNSVIKTSDIRARPKKIVNPKDRNFLNEMINISGENLPKILFSMVHSDDPKLKSQYGEILSEFKKITKGLEIDVQVKPVIRKTTERTLTEFSDATRLDNMTNVGLKDQQKETIEQEVSVQIIKNNIPIPIEFAAAGIVELIILLTAIIGQKSKVLLLDEPALNLHSILQKRVLQLIQRAVSKYNNQVILITHSPFLLNPENFENSWKFSSTKKGTNIINISEIIHSMGTNEKERTVTRLHNSEIRSMLFQHGIVLVEGPSDKIVLEKTDRYLTDNELDGPNIEDNEWMILDVGGKDSFTLILNLVKKLKIPHISVFDYDSLMQCTKKITINGSEIRTSSAISTIYQTGELTTTEIKLVKKLENSIIEKIKNLTNNEKIKQYWYNPTVTNDLNTIAKKHNMYILTKDLEGVIQSNATPKDSKPLKALDRINNSLAENKVPSEIKLVMKFIKTKIENTKR